MYVNVKDIVARQRREPLRVKAFLIAWHGCFREGFRKGSFQANTPRVTGMVGFAEMVGLAKFSKAMDAA